MQKNQYKMRTIVDTVWMQNSCRKSSLKIYSFESTTIVRGQEGVAEDIWTIVKENVFQMTDKVNGDLKVNT